MQEDLRVVAVTNVYPSKKLPSLGSFVEQQVEGLRRLGAQVRVVLANRGEQGVFAYLGLIGQVRLAAKEFRPHVIHVMYGGVMADVVTSTFADIPVVVSFCGSDLLGENLSGSFRKLAAYYGVLSSRRAARRASGIIVKSKNLQDVLPAKVARSKVRIIPNGVDLERFRPLDRDTCRRSLAWKGNHFHVLFASSSGNPVKRPQLAKAATEELTKLGVQAEMHELRGVAHEDVPTWLNASDVLLLTSLQEGSPNIVKEALACDLPVVSVDVGDVRERIEEIAGCYLARGEPACLAQKLRIVHSGPGRVEGRIKVADLSLERIAARLAGFYREVMKNVGFGKRQAQ
jgi:teichuronic acid biosynthesis glycosyltransferase TuaC